MRMGWVAIFAVLEPEVLVSIGNPDVKLRSRLVSCVLLLAGACCNGQGMEVDLRSRAAKPIDFRLL